MIDLHPDFISCNFYLQLHWITGPNDKFCFDIRNLPIKHHDFDLYAVYEININKKIKEALKYVYSCPH